MVGTRDFTDRIPAVVEDHDSSPVLTRTALRLKPHIRHDSEYSKEHRTTELSEGTTSGRPVRYTGS